MADALIAQLEQWIGAVETVEVLVGTLAKLAKMAAAIPWRISDTRAERHFVLTKCKALLLHCLYPIVMPAVSYVQKEPAPHVPIRENFEAGGESGASSI